MLILQDTSTGMDTDDDDKDEHRPRISKKRKVFI